MWWAPSNEGKRRIPTRPKFDNDGNSGRKVMETGVPASPKGQGNPSNDGKASLTDFPIDHWGRKSRD